MRIFSSYRIAYFEELSNDPDVAKTIKSIYDNNEFKVIVLQHKDCWPDNILDIVGTGFKIQRQDGRDIRFDRLSSDRDLRWSYYNAKNGLMHLYRITPKEIGLEPEPVEICIFHPRSNTFVFINDINTVDEFEKNKDKIFDDLRNIIT